MPAFAGADGEILAQIARQYDGWGYNHEAIQSYVRAVEFSPENPPLWVRLAVLQRGMDKVTESREALEEVLRRYPDYAPAYRELGRTYEQAGDLARAIPVFEALLDDTERLGGRDHVDTLRAQKPRRCLPNSAPVR